MLSTEDIKKITQAQIDAQKDLFYTKTEMDAKFSALHKAVEEAVKSDSDKEDELTIINYRVKKTEDWIDKAAPKIDIEFEH